MYTIILIKQRNIEINLTAKDGENPPIVCETSVCASNKNMLTFKLVSGLVMQLEIGMWNLVFRMMINLNTRQFIQDLDRMTHLKLQI